LVAERGRVAAMTMQVSAMHSITETERTTPSHDADAQVLQVSLLIRAIMT